MHSTTADGPRANAGGRPAALAATAAFGDALLLTVRLAGIDPPVWRKLRVPADVTLADLHAILQVAFGWGDCHLHEFRVGPVRFGVPDLDDYRFVADERSAPLGAVAQVGVSFSYVYDFGDDWHHEVLVHEVIERGAAQGLACLGGERACPPEDAGGPEGYGRLRRAAADPGHPDHAEARKRLGRRFDGEAFDGETVSRKLGTLGRRIARPRSGVRGER